MRKDEGVLGGVVEASGEGAPVCSTAHNRLPLWGMSRAGPVTLMGW